MTDRNTLIVHIQDEIKQKSEEGCDTAEVALELRELQESSAGVRQLRGLLRRVEGLKPRPDFPYVEPSTLAAIKRERPEGVGTFDIELPDDERFDKTYGAWLGRCAGCILGKPVEGWTKEKIEKVLKLADAYPLSSYFPPLPENEEGIQYRYENCLLGRIKGAAKDDDLDYTILGLHLLETKGRDFTPRDVARAWLDLLPYHRVHTAERVAYRNLINGLAPPQSARYRNPYREWIGAQIRADIWGYVNPCKPEAAAEMAFRDASISHVKNGIYGEMLFSGIIAAAFATKDIDTAINGGLAQIPRKSRLAEAVLQTLEWSRMDADWQATWRRVMEKYGDYHRVHTINNAAFVILALIHGKMDFGKTICISVMCGLDTDCNGATAGSIMGAILGAKALPAEWIDCLEDTVESHLSGMSLNRVSDLARRTVALQCR